MTGRPPPLPSSTKQWSKEAEECGVSDTSVHDLLNVDSASTIKPHQYYSLRVLWVVHKPLPDATVLGFSQLDPIYRKASEFLSNKSPSWQNYLDDIARNPGSSSANIRDFGAFSNVRYYQLHVDHSSVAYKNTREEDMESVPSKFSPRHLRSVIPASTKSNPLITPSKGQNLIKSGSSLDFDSSFDDNSRLSTNSFSAPTPQTPATTETTAPAEDEQIVNVALVLWLQTLTMFHSGVQEEGLKWSIKRLKLGFGRWEARTDGCLRRQKEIKAILEVKPYVREKYAPLIQKQESAQMAAWVRNFPYGGGWTVMRNERTLERRLLLSQDSYEIYLTVAEFEPAYKEYICAEQGSNNPERSFMTMNQYGPWDTKKMQHMRQLGKLLLAFTLRCAETSNDTLQSKGGAPPTPVNPKKINNDPFETERELSPTPANPKKAHIEKGKMTETTKNPAKPGTTGTTNKTVKPPTSAPTETSELPSTSEGLRPTAQPMSPALALRSGKPRKPNATEKPPRPREPWK